LKYFLLKILERYFLPKILKKYFLPKYLRDPLFSGSDEISFPWWLSLQILYNEGFPWRKENGGDLRYQTYDIGRKILVMMLGASCKVYMRRTWGGYCYFIYSL